MLLRWKLYGLFELIRGTLLGIWMEAAGRVRWFRQRLKMV